SFRKSREPLEPIERILGPTLRRSPVGWRLRQCRVGFHSKSKGLVRRAKRAHEVRVVSPDTEGLIKCGRSTVDKVARNGRWRLKRAHDHSSHTGLQRGRGGDDIVPLLWQNDKIGRPLTWRLKICAERQDVDQRLITGPECRAIKLEEPARGLGLQ